MTMSFASFTFAAAAGVLLTAATPSPPQGGSNARASDSGSAETMAAGAEKIICRKDKAVGSRVTAKRVCMTAQQWEAQRMDDRQRLEQGQAQRTYSNSGG